MIEMEGINGGVEWSLKKPEKVSVWEGEKVSLEEARSKLVDSTTDLTSSEPKDIPQLNSEVRKDKKEEDLKPFESETWKTYRDTVVKVVNCEETHKRMLDKTQLPMNKSEIEDLIRRNGWVKEELADEISHRVEMFLWHSLDVEVIKLRVKMCLDTKASELDAPIFNREEKEKLTKSFSEDQRLQVLWANLMARNMFSSSSLDGDQRDWKNSEILINAWMRKSGIEGNDNTRKKLEAIFFNKYKMPRHALSEKRLLDAKSSMSLVGLKPAKSGTRYLEESLVFGRRDFLHQRARKTEAVRFLCKLEKVQDDVLDIKLPRPVGYSIGEALEDERTSTYVYIDEKTINWGLDDDFKVTLDDNCFDQVIETSSLTAEWNEDRTKQKYSYVKAKAWISAWSAMAHERGHLRLAEMFLDDDKNDWREVTKALESVTVPTGTPGPVYTSKLSRTLEEGWAVFVQNNANQVVRRNPDLFNCDKEGEDIRVLGMFQRSRSIRGKKYSDHYWLGQKVVSALNMDGYRELIVGEERMSIEELTKRREENGIKKVVEFLSKLDLKKITAEDSRLRFERAGLEGWSNRRKVRKVWIKFDKSMILREQNDRANKILDFLTSTKPEKRKLGQEAFLKMFGKEEVVNQSLDLE